MSDKVVFVVLGLVLNERILWEVVVAFYGFVGFESPCLTATPLAAHDVSASTLSGIPSSGVKLKAKKRSMIP